MVANAKDSGSKPIDAAESVDDQQRRQTVRQPVWCFAIMCDQGRHILASFDFSDPDKPDIFVEGAGELTEATPIGHCRLCSAGSPIKFGTISRVLGWARYPDVFQWDAAVRGSLLSLFIRDVLTSLHGGRTLGRREVQNLYDLCGYLESHSVSCPPFSREAVNAMHEDRSHNRDAYPQITNAQFTRFSRDIIENVPFSGLPYYAIPLWLIRRLCHAAALKTKAVSVNRH
jgi:hypothetical protein